MMDHASIARGHENISASPAGFIGGYQAHMQTALNFAEEQILSRANPGERRGVFHHQPRLASQYADFPSVPRGGRAKGDAAAVGREGWRELGHFVVVGQLHGLAIREYLQINVASAEKGALAANVSEHFSVG